MRENDKLLLSFFIGIGVLGGLQIVLVAAPERQLEWISGIGILTAVFLALRIASKHGHDDAMVRRLQARSLGLALHPEVRGIQSRTGAARMKLLNAPASLTISGAEARMLEVPLPHVLSENVKNLYVFGEPLGTQLQSLVAELGAYNGVLAELRTSAMHGALDEVANALRGHLDRTSQLAQVVETGLEELTR